MSKQPKALPLAGYRVLDLCDRIGQSCGRFLADLGAEVILVEPIEGMASRSRAPLFEGRSLYFESHNANKKSVAIELASERGRQKFLKLVESADLLLDGSQKGELVGYGLDMETLRHQKPDLIVLSITDFGLQGPYKDFIATDAVHVAMGALLCRSGINGREPLLPPGEMAGETSGIQAAWVALLALWQRRYTGRGDLLDFSINDCVAQILDPGVGATGSGAAGRTAVEVTEHSRPVVTDIPGKMPSLALLYPVFQCRDGQVRICVLNPRQWTAMSEWLGEDHPFQDPKYAQLGVRLMEIAKVNALIAEHFKDCGRQELLDEGQKRGIPIAPIAHSAELLEDEHYAAREFFAQTPWVAPDAKMPAGYLYMDSQRVGLRTAAPAVGQHSDEILGDCQPKQSQYGSEPGSRKPLEGLVVLDLGVIVAGGELGRLFADQGANVIKVENKEFADGLRNAFDGNPVPIPFVLGSRGKRSLGLNLRSEKGLALFYDLVKKADVVMSNFKPGTTKSLGIDYDTLKAVNPAIVCAESSAMGSIGPRANTMGYGPLVRASTSLSWLWRYPDLETGLGDSVTIYPDHFAARISAAAILAKLIQRQETGVGGSIDLSQAETVMQALATEFLQESVEPGSMKARGNRNEFDAPNSVFQCNGDDEWCVVAVGNDQQWQGLCRAMQRPDLLENDAYTTSSKRLANVEELERIVAKWCEEKTNYQVMQLCQEEGVPAGNMLRLSEFLENPHYLARQFFRTIYQPTVGRDIETENAPVGFSETLPQPEIIRAPARAEHTREIAREFLALTDKDIDALAASGDLELGKPAEYDPRIEADQG